VRDGGGGHGEIGAPRGRYGIAVALLIGRIQGLQAIAEALLPGGPARAGLALSEARHPLAARGEDIG
jgi:hypothetical protein